MIKYKRFSIGGYTFLFLLGVLLWQSCSTPGNLILNQTIQKLNYSSQILNYETHLFHQAVKQKIRRGASQYKPLTLKKQFLCQSQLELQHYLDDMISQSTYQKIDGQYLLGHLVQIRQTYLDSILSLWQKGGIKGTIFSDAKRMPSQKIHLKNLLSPINLIIKDTAVIKNHFKTNRSCLKIKS
jgi:hypothetical protein